MITGSRPTDHPVRPGMKWQAATARSIRRIARMTLRFIVSSAGWIGGAILASRYSLHAWNFLIATAIMIVGLAAFFRPARIDAEGYRVRVFWTCRGLAAICFCALFIMLELAAPNQELQEHGVAEGAVVTGESSTTSVTGADNVANYFYSLRALNGPVIHGSLAAAPARNSVAA